MQRVKTSIACMTLLPGAAFAFQPLVTDDTGTQGARGNQVEWSYRRTSDKAPGIRDVTHDMPLVFTRGITDAFDLHAGFAYRRLVPQAPEPSQHGWSNTALGAKWRFYENEASKLSFALKPELQLPVSQAREARGLGTARASYGTGLLMTQETGFGAIHANLTVERLNHADAALDAAARRTRYRASLAPVWDIAPHWKVALDAGVVTNHDPAARRLLGYIEGGAIYAPAEDLEIAVGVIRNLRDGNRSTTQATAGLTWRFR
jgi:hypothetical protein